MIPYIVSKKWGVLSFLLVSTVLAILIWLAVRKCPTPKEVSLQPTKATASQAVEFNNDFYGSIYKADEKKYGKISDKLTSFLANKYSGLGDLSQKLVYVQVKTYKESNTGDFLQSFKYLVNPNITGFLSTTIKLEEGTPLLSTSGIWLYLGNVISSHKSSLPSLLDLQTQFKDLGTFTYTGLTGAIQYTPSSALSAFVPAATLWSTSNLKIQILSNESLPSLSE